MTDNSESTTETGQNDSELRRRKTDGVGLFGRRFANTSRFVVSSKVWMNQIPTRDCDVLLTFPANTDDHTLMWLLARLRSRTPELEVHVRHHSNTGVYGFYFTARYKSLLKACAELELKKQLKDEFGGGMKEFEYDDRDTYRDVEEEYKFFTSQERQNIVRHILFNLRAVSGDELGKLKFLEGQAIVPRLLSKKLVRRVLPLHNNEDLTELRKTWVQAFTKAQPLGKICEYFGVKIALYFAYLGHYTAAVCIPAFFGLVIYLCTYYIHDQEIDDICFVVFALFNVVWATLYLEHWKRRSSEMAYKWGTLDHQPDLLAEPRPLFTGELRTSPVTGRVEFYYPSWKRHLFRYLVSIPIMFCCLCVVFAVMLMIFRLDEYVIGEIKLGKLPMVCKFGPKIFLALCIGILDDIYKRVALWLNEMENYRNAKSYENHYILKLVCFQFVNSFLSLFYLAFYVQDMRRLREQLAALLITRQVIGNIKEALVPYVIEKVKLFHVGYKMTADMSPDTLEKEMQEIIARKYADSRSSSFESAPSADPSVDDISKEHGTDTDYNRESPEAGSGSGGRRVSAQLDGVDVSFGGPQLTQAEVEGNMPAYDDTFEDYLEMFIQFGYVILFSSAFPLAALCALLNNVIEIRSDAFKLCTTLQRPFGKQVEDIGIWQDMLELMAIIAIAVNSALIGMSGLVNRWFPHLSNAQIFLTIVVLEHLILAFRCALAYAIPDVPQWIAEEMAKWEFRRRLALKRVQSQQSREQERTPVRTFSQSNGEQLSESTTSSS